MGIFQRLGQWFPQKVEWATVITLTITALYLIGDRYHGSYLTVFAIPQDEAELQWQKALFLALFVLLPSALLVVLTVALGESRPTKFWEAAGGNFPIAIGALLLLVFFNVETWGEKNLPLVVLGLVIEGLIDGPKDGASDFVGIINELNDLLLTFFNWAPIASGFLVVVVLFVFFSWKLESFSYVIVNSNHRIKIWALFIYLGVIFYVTSPVGKMVAYSEAFGLTERYEIRFYFLDSKNEMHLKPFGYILQNKQKYYVFGPLDEKLWPLNVWVIPQSNISKATFKLSEGNLVTGGRQLIEAFIEERS